MANEEWHPVLNGRGIARRLERLSQGVLRDAPTVAALAPTSRVTAVRQALSLEEILSSTSLAGFSLDAVAGAALLSRGVAVGGHRLEMYEAVADYADAVRFIDAAEARPLRPNIFVRADEILQLHRRAMHRTGRLPGSWRERNVSGVPTGLVPPPHWLVPREMAAFVDRYAPGPARGTPPLLWAASAHARLLRIQPFDGGNGRVARLVGNLLLRRLGLPAAAFGGRRARRYRAAIAQADGGDATPLAELIAESLHESMTRLLAAASAELLRPLRELVPSQRLAALMKAAQRGRLRVVRRGTRFYTTAEWLADYEAGRG